ncbi:transcription initiation factor TFIID subunit 2 [Nematocida ausubeli]|nr:transcription initiation factor TFIID subunit 2 [Nematocida ausubeli]
MNVTHQKNILHLSMAERRCTGTSIFYVDVQKEERLEILQIQLNILKVEIFSENAWKSVKIESTVVLPVKTEKVRILFETKKNNPGISFYTGPDNKCTEFTGEPINGQAQTLFPLLSTRPCSLEMVYIVSIEKGFQVISSGTLSGIYDGGTTKTFHYKMDYARPQDVLFAGGMYEEIHAARAAVFIPEAVASRFEAGGKESLEALKSSIVAAQQALECKLPFYKISVVFSMCNVTGSIGRNCAVFNISQIIVPEAIDQCFASIRLISKITANQYFGILAHPTSDLDTWMYTGLSEYVSMYLAELFLGVNEAKYELNRNIDYIHKHDIEEPPLSSPSRHRSTFHSPFFVKKAGAFVKILENNLTRAFMQKIMKEVLEARTMNTQDLIRVIKGITGKDVRALFDAYVYRTGIPTVTAQVEQNSRAGGFSLVLRQKIHSVHPDANRHMAGNICVRVYETDSVLDHILFLGSAPITHELVCSQRNHRRKQKEENVSLLWVRIDPGIEWMKVAAVEQADYMFAEQLVSEKDVYGQMEALVGVQKNPSETICSILERVMGDPGVFYKVSIAAGILLAKSVNEESGYFGFQRVVQFFINTYCIQNTTIVRTNDFSQHRMYFMQKNIASSMSLCQLDSTKSLGGRAIRAKNVVSAFLLNLMRYNDNTGNSFEDAFYLADIITALAVALCSDAHLDPAPFIVEMERLRQKDLLFPSHQNIVTCAAIKAFARLGVQGYVQVSFKGMLQYVAPGNFYKVRMAAYECLILLHADKIGTILELFVNEERPVRIKILRTIRDSAVCAALPIFGKLQEHLPHLQRIQEMFAGDGEADALFAEIEGLLGGPTELVSDAVEEAIMHDMSSDEEDRKLPRLVIKLFKPVVIRLSTKGMLTERNNSSTQQETEHEKEEEIEGHISEGIDVDALYENDVQAETYCLDKSQAEGACRMVERIKASKASSHITQMAKKNEVSEKMHVPTFDDINIKTRQASEEDSITKSPAQDSAPIEKGSQNKSQKNRKQSTDIHNDTADPDTIEIEISHKDENAHLNNEMKCLFNTCDEYPMYEIYSKAAYIFREYFKSAQYDTSSYSTIKYFQAHFEREYFAFFQTTSGSFHKVDAPCKEKDGRAHLLSIIDQAIHADRHGIFSTPIDTDLLREYKYQEIVRRPLDLQTIRSRVEEGDYFMVECVLFDIIQVFVNCLTYNLKDSEIYKEALFVQSAVQKIVKNATAGYTETCTLKDALSMIIQQIIETGEYSVFYDRVNREEYPQYYAVVKEPMTLSLIKDRAESNYYKNITHFESEFQRISTATLLYNGQISEITKLGKALTQKVQTSVQRTFPWYRSIFNKRATLQHKTKAQVSSNKKAKSQK